MAGTATVTVTRTEREPVTLTRRTRHPYRFAVVGMHHGEPYLVSMHLTKEAARKRRGLRPYLILPVTYTA